MQIWKRALALAPALVAAAGCQHIGDWTRTAAGLDESPVRTEYDDGTPPARTLARAGFDARSSLVTAVEALVEARQNGESDQQQLAVALFDRAEEYYHVGRLAMRSQCESFMQTLASVDGQTTFGRDLANNFFDTATVAATITGSPSIWATGLSTTQNSFNSVSGSTERFLLLTESVGALRERVISRMAASEGTAIDFDAGRTNITGATALDYTRRAIEAVQRYGTPCTEAGIRLIVTEALSTDDIGRQAQRSRYESHLTTLHRIINEGRAKDAAQIEIDDADVRLMYLWAISAGADADSRAGMVRNQIQTARLEFLARLSDDQKSRVSYYAQQAIDDRPDLREQFDSLRDELLADYRRDHPPATPTQPEAPVQETPAEPQPQPPPQP